MARQKQTGPTGRELTILGILWVKGPSTVHDVHEALHQRGKTGYTTTLKLMQIMLEKGLVVREDAGRRHIYRPAQSEEKTQKQVVKDLLGKAFAGSAEKLVMRALSVKKVSSEELQNIRKMLDEIEGE
jgi:predicted transcriptional regulator